MKGLSLAPTENSNLFSTLFQRKPKYQFRLVDFKNKQHKTDFLLSQTKCNLDILEEGVMIVGNFAQDDTIISILKDEIEHITLVRGKEVVDTFYLSPMYILSKLGVPNNISRYLKVYPSEYQITETRITIKCKEYQLKLIASGSRFEKLLRSFKKNGYMSELNLIEKPSLNLLQYNA